jgi:hypothetical protein
MKLRSSRGATWSFEENDQIVPHHLLSSWRKDQGRLELLQPSSAGAAECESAVHSGSLCEDGDGSDVDAGKDDNDATNRSEFIAMSDDEEQMRQNGNTADPSHPGGGGAEGGNDGDVISVSQLTASVLPEKAVFSGVFRSSFCRRVRGSDDAQLDDGMCAKCASITKEEDFRGRMKRSRADIEKADHTRFSYLSRSELLARSRQLRQRVRALEYQVYFHSRRIATMKGRRLELKERIEEAAGRGDVRKVVDELVRAQATLQQKTVLLNFMYDLARNANAKSAKGKRWSTSTKNLYEVRTCCRVVGACH